MNKWKVGVIREGKVPPDERVPLTPGQCKLVMAKFPNVEVIVQPSPIRAFADETYRAEGIRMEEDLSTCDLIMGVKEVNVEDLIPEKKFMFFSHTIKKQPYNRRLLQTILEKKIELIDYENIKDKNGKRLIGFGRYAGIVGCYNAFLTFGLKTGLYELKAAHDCHDRKEVELELRKVVLPKNMRLVLTGFGRVGHGAREILDMLPIKEVTPEEYLNDEFREPVYTHLEAEDYYARKDGKPFNKQEFYAEPALYKSVFNRYAQHSDMYIPCHFWSNKSPYILTLEDLQSNKRLKVVADISCDIAGPIASTIRPSKVADPIYGFDAQTNAETDFREEGAIAVMAIDNLPCELPKDASEDFGNELIKNVLTPLFGDDPDAIIERAQETDAFGKLMPRFSYLQDYVDGKE